jgi:ketosteroid isomerase-like protein
MKGGHMKTQRTSLPGRVSVFFLICGLVVFWGFQVSGEEWTEAQKELWKSVETEWEYCVQGNVKAIMAGYHDDAVYWSLGYFRGFDKTITSGKDLIEAAYKYDLLGLFRPVSYELEPLAINIFGDVANVFYRYKYKKDGITPPRNQAFQGSIMLSYIKQNNKWIVIGDMRTRLKVVTP